MRSVRARRLLPISILCLVSILCLGAVEWAGAVQDDPMPDLGEAESPDPLLFTYAQIVQNNVPVYASPEDAALGRWPVRRLGAGLVWVSLDKVPRYVEYKGETWVMINPNEYVHANALRIYQPSRFQGVTLSEPPAYPFGWVLEPVQPSQTPGGPPNSNVSELKRYDRVIIYAVQHLNGGDWYQIGPDEWVSQKLVSKVWIVPRPRVVGPGEKWIEVDRSEQTLAAYEGDRMVYATLVSTGLPRSYTPEGLTRIWAKIRTMDLSGLMGTADSYYLEDVPWVMYFNRNEVLNQGIAIHAAYWHDAFGYRYSHGCINVSPRDAQWLFNWTRPAVSDHQRAAWSTGRDPGTWVWVHE